MKDYEEYNNGLSRKETVEVQEDEIKYLFDTLTDNRVPNIMRITGFSKQHVHRVVDAYTNPLRRFN